MRVVIDRPEARWLPSRHRYALSRLIALVALRFSRGSVPSNRRLILPIDRDQSAPENHAIALWLLITTTLFLVALVRPALWILMPFAAAALLEVPFFVAGAFLAPIVGRRGADNKRLTSAATFVALAAASAWFAWTLTWARFVAYFFFAVLAVNAVAFVAMLLLRGVVERIESEYGGTSFAP